MRQPRRNLNFPQRAKTKNKEKKNTTNKTVGDISQNIFTFITQASAGDHKMLAVLCHQKADHDQDVPSVDHGDWGQERDTYCIVCSLFVNDVLYRILCFVKKVLTSFTPYTFISHTKMSIVFGTGRGACMNDFT